MNSQIYIYIKYTKYINTNLSRKVVIIVIKYILVISISFIKVVIIIALSQLKYNLEDTDGYR